MRTSIILWSVASGVILGLFVDATLIGVALLLGTLVPGLSDRLQQRWIAGIADGVLVLIPAAMAVLGYLEGRLKAL